ncbi:MAG TPA: tetratricopeptide repeat protein, partial [Anaerolineales bacterium]
GSRIGADLVIWGQLEQSEDQTILSFSVLETPDKISNPMFVRVLPLYEMAATSFFKVGSRQSEEIAKGTTTLSSFTFGLAHYFQWDFVAATEAFDQTLRAAAGSPDDSLHYLTYFYDGLSLQGLQEFEEANQAFEKAIQANPDDPAPRVARAWGYQSLGQIKEGQDEAETAWTLCSKQIQLQPDNYAAYFDRALANEVLKSWDAALVDYQATRDKAPDLYIAYIGIARIQMILHRLAEAAATMREAISLAESKRANPAWAYVYLAVVEERRADPVQARAAFEKAISLAPKVDYMHMRFGQFLETTGSSSDLVNAESEYRVNVDVSNNKAMAHADLARFLARHGRLEEALAEYHTALQYDPQAAGIWTEMAELLAGLDRLDDARAGYDRALELDPGNVYAHLSFGGFLYDQHAYESAIREWEGVRPMDPDNCRLLLNLGQAYELLGAQEHAALLYRQVYADTTEKSQECRDEAARRLTAVTK